MNRAINSLDFGFLFCAVGRKYVEQARISVTYLRMIEPMVPIALVTDQSKMDELKLEFDFIFEHPNPKSSFDDKIDALSLTPFKKTLYLDCDTMAIRPMAAELSLALDSYDLLARPGMSFNEDWETSELSSVFPQFNAGVIGFSSHAIRVLLPEWRRYLEKYPGAIDQAHFRLACFQAPVKILPLTSDYNFMGFDTIVNQVKIVHFANVRRREIFSKKRVGRGMALSKRAAGTHCIYWRPVWGERTYLVNLAACVIQLTIEFIRTRIAMKGFTRKRIKSKLLFRDELEVN